MSPLKFQVPPKPGVELYSIEILELSFFKKAFKLHPKNRLMDFKKSV